MRWISYNHSDREATGYLCRRRVDAPRGEMVKRMDDVVTNADGRAGSPAASAEDLLPLVYKELRKLAAARMAGERETSTLQPTALVHEAWLRLSGPQPQTWENRAHFFAAAAEAMRRILIDHARRKHAQRRGGAAKRIDLDQIDVAAQADDESLLMINEALERLAVQDEQSAALVKLRFFIGMSYDEAARTLGISERTAKRCWTFARAWLFRELSQRDESVPEVR